jgi:hypothetical protein
MAWYLCSYDATWPHRLQVKLQLSFSADYTLQAGNQLHSAVSTCNDFFANLHTGMPINATDNGDYKIFTFLFKTC